MGAGQGAGPRPVPAVILPILFRPLAETEYNEAADWYDDREPGLGAEFEARVEAALSVIAGQPDRYPAVVRDIREAPVSRFPFCIYYRVRSNRIIVVSVFHQSRDPKEWQSRI